jgi:DNA primase
MKFDQRFLDDIRARLPVSHVVSKKVQLKKKGREFAGLSPFKDEKTASFFVNDQKGFYHCFASGEHGDIFTFLIKTEGLSFPEAVERLAAEAGVAMPERRQQDPERENRRERLQALMDAAASFFVQQFRSSVGREARNYLEGRQIGEQAIDAFRLGYAPNSRTALRDHLLAKGFTGREMADAGTLISGPDIQTPYDRFRHRVMFPICDAKGRVVAFGGRALSSDQPAKYLNSPETPLFHKGHLLFNAHRARQAAFEADAVIVVEGYMDVIALAQAGFAHAVAPLGTALTEEQIGLLWRMAPEPILCFDGDSAGQKAAHRAIDTVLPNLKAGHSLRFVFLPDDLDPDDLIRQRGSDALKDLLHEARPLVDVLWEREWNAGAWTTPERRAAFEERLRNLIRTIPDPGIRMHYGQLFKDRLWQAWRTMGRGGGTKSGSAGRQSQYVDWRNAMSYNQARRGSERASARHRQAVPRSRGLVQSTMVMGGDETLTPREAQLVRALINHPWLIEEFAEDIAELTFASPVAARLKSQIEMLCLSDNCLDNAALRNHLERLRLGSDVELVERVATHKGDKFAEPETDRVDVEAGWRHALALHGRQTLRHELEAAEAEYRDTGDDEVMSRIVEIQRRIAASEAFEVSAGG